MTDRRRGRSIASLAALTALLHHAGEHDRSPIRVKACRRAFLRVDANGSLRDASHINKDREKARRRRQIERGSLQLVRRKG